MSEGVSPAVGDVLHLAFAGQTSESRELAARALASSAPDKDHLAAIVAATVFADYIDARFAEALVAARRAVELASGGAPEVVALASAVHALALSNEPAVDPSIHERAFERAMEGRGALVHLPAGAAWLAQAVLVEAAFANGKIADSGVLLAERNRSTPPADPAWFALLQPVRVHLFGGELADALSACASALAVDPARQARPFTALTHAFLALIAAYQDDASAVATHVAAVKELVETPGAWVDGGSHIVAGFALATAGDLGAARALILSGGGGPMLHLAQVVDRALGYDILVSAALADDDALTASLWARRAHGLYTVPAAALAVEQIDSRLALARGDAGEGGERAAIAAERARAAGRLLEATNADLALASAMLAAGDTGLAVGQLNAAAHDAETAGALALRHRATVELRMLGRRLEPRRGGGKQALSQRELEVATLAAEGFTTRHVAQALFLSERTVQEHLRRAMRALGVSSRAALPLALGTASDAPRVGMPPLTARQHEVALCVREGLSNTEIAARLGISVKTVEKHVAMIFASWGVTNRTGIARRATTGERPAA